MTKPTEPAHRPTRRLAALGMAGALAAVAAVYVIVGPNGNSNSGQSCALSLDIAEAIKPLATGEVAAFLPAQGPLPLSEVSFNTPENTPTSLADFKDRTILMNLWATWCAPCRKEMPALDELQADLGDETFEVVTVNLDRSGSEKPKAFLDEIGVSHLRFFHDSSNKMMTDLRAKGRATGLPTTILVGPDGCEVGTMYGPAEWASGDAKALINAALGAQKAPGT